VFLTLILEQFDRDRVSAICYSDRREHDAYCESLRHLAAEWHDTNALSDSELVDRIRLSVFARRIAPIQITRLGFTGPTGVAEMDYLLCDRFHVPEEDEEYSSFERPLRMQHGYVCWRPPDYAPDPGPPPVLTTGRVTFGSLNNPSKLNPTVARIWSKILNGVPESRLLLKYKGYDERGMQNHVCTLFAKDGIEATRIELNGGSTHVEHLAVCRQVDIGLDPFP